MFEKCDTAKFKDSLEKLMALSIAFSLKRDRVLAYTLKRRNENKMDKLKEKLSRLMYGRYGIDQLGNFMMWAAVAMMISERLYGAPLSTPWHSS